MVDVNEARVLEDLERFLLGAPVACSFSEARGGWQGKARVLLTGGVLVLQKPTRGTNAPPAAGLSPEVAVKREAAAWTIAKALGWSHLVAPTVIRIMQPSTGGEECLVSLQVFWPEPTVALPALDGLEPFDVWRAAVFDTIIKNADRGQNNWLGIGPDMDNRLHLKLCDHGHAFGAGPTTSSFVTHVGDDSVPATVRDQITVGLNNWPHERLYDQLGDVAKEIPRRLHAVADDGRLSAVH